MTSHTLIALVAAAALFAGCKKKASPPATPPAAGAAAGTAAPTPPAPPAADLAAAPPAAPSAAAAAADELPAAAVAVEPAAPGEAVPAEPPGAMPSDAEITATASKTLEMLTSIGDAVEKSGTDCGAMATALEKVMADSAGLIAQVKKWEDNRPVQEKLMAAMNPEAMGKQAGRISGGLAACQDDARIAAALSSMAQ